MCDQFGLTGRTAAPSSGFKRNVSNKITAKEVLLKDSVSEVFPSEDLDGFSVKHDRHFSKIRLSPSGVVVPDYVGYNTSQSCWIRHLRLSPNIHYQNAVLELCKSNTFRVRVMADIQVGQEINLWFSQELLVAMQIPFLTLLNIRGT